MKHARRAKGFTLLELLVALAVFALVSVLAYGGLRAVLDVREHTDRAAAQLGRLQVTLALMARDFEQLVKRPRRDAFGYWQASLRYDPHRVPERVELVRAGGRGASPTVLQRVAWELDDGVLYRDDWAVVDGSGEAPDNRVAMLGSEAGERVTRFEMRFVQHAERGMQQASTWPPPRVEPNEAPLPEVVEVLLDVAGTGRIMRTFPVARP